MCSDLVWRVTVCDISAAPVTIWLTRKWPTLVAASTPNVRYVNRDAHILLTSHFISPVMPVSVRLCVVTTSKMQATLSSVAISGPTYESLPPFVWSQSNFSHVPHYGQPDAWKFPWITMQPQWP